MSKSIMGKVKKQIKLMRSSKMKNNVEKLEPCPFCGEKPIIEHTKLNIIEHFSDDRLITDWKVYCPRCKIEKLVGSSEYRLNYDETLELISFRGDGRKDAIKMWNTRVGE